MGKIKKLIPLLTIETAVILMLISLAAFIPGSEITNANLGRAIYYVVDYLYTIKYIVGLITIYLIMRDKKSIVLGYFGMAYVITSTFILIYEFFIYFDYDTPLLEQFFVYYDPLIIYIALAVVFICFIAEKGNKYFLFGLVAIIMLADMTVGSIFCYGHFSKYSFYNEIYTKFEADLLEVFNTDFYLQWFLICFVFIVETILILLFAIPARKKESEETDDSKEKNEKIKASTVVITTLASILLAFLTILCIIRPLVRICDYSNYEDSFIHKTIAWIPLTRDKIADASPHEIISGYPFDNEEDVKWTYYPNDNMIGLVASTRVQGESEDTIVLAFKYLNSAKNISNTIINYKYLGCRARYGYFSFDNPEVYKKKKIYYVKLTYDNRIIEPGIISFDRDKERINIDILDDDINITYCNFGEEITVRKYQDYDSASGTWGDITTEEEEREIYSDFGPHTYTELNLDREKSWSLEYPEGVKMYAEDYEYRNENRNIYGEIETPQFTDLGFSIKYYGKIVGNRIVYEETPEEVLSYIEDGNFKLYVKENGVYKDITPEDAEVEYYSADEYGTYYSMKSNLLEELTEGDYKLEFGGYSDEFTLSIQTQVVW